jgi:hypothetical protein
MQLRLHRQCNNISTKWQFVFNIFTCFAVGSEPNSHQNSIRSRIRIQILRLRSDLGQSGFGKIRIFARSRSRNFDLILFWIQIQPHFEWLKDSVTRFLATGFTRGRILNRIQVFFIGRIHPYPAKMEMDLICQPILFIQNLPWNYWPKKQFEFIQLFTTQGLRL